MLAMIGLEGQGAPVRQGLWIVSRRKLPIHSNDMGGSRPRLRPQARPANSVPNQTSRGQDRDGGEAGQGRAAGMIIELYRRGL